MRFGKDLPQSSPGSRPCEAIAESSQAAQLDDEARSAGAAAAAALAAPSEAIGDAPAAADLLQADDFEDAESLYDLSDAAAEAFLEHQLKRGAAAVTATTQSNRQFQLLLQHMPEGPKAAAAAISAQRSSNPWERSSDVQQHPQRLVSFKDLGVLASLLEALKAQGYRIPTPVQAAALPVTLAEHDAVIQAKSGTGKTVAFAVHALQRLLLAAAAWETPPATAAADCSPALPAADRAASEPAAAGGFFGFALVIAPSRELATQTAAEMRSLAQHIPHIHIGVCCLLGGFALNVSKQELSKRPQIIVATPGNKQSGHVGALRPSLNTQSFSPPSPSSPLSTVLAASAAATQQASAAALEASEAAETRSVSLRKVALDCGRCKGHAENTATFAASAEAAAVAAAALCSCRHNVPLQQQLKQELRVVILDEADLLLDTFFRPQTKSASTSCTLLKRESSWPSLLSLLRAQPLEILDRVLHPSAQLTAYSATFAPQLLHYLEEELLQDAERLLPVSEADTPQEIQQSVIKECSEQRLSLQPRALWRVMLCASRVRRLSLLRDDSFVAVTGIIYGLMEVPPAEQSGLRVLSIKLQMLLDVISRIYFRQAVIFVNEPLVGRLPQRERNKRLAALKQFQCRVMVCSDLMSRGIDAIGIDLVINFNLPMDKDTFLHRGGRAGRYGSWGVCVSIASSDEADSYRYIAASYGITLHALQDIEQLQAVLRPEVRALRAPANAAATTLSRAANAHASAAAASDEVPTPSIAAAAAAIPAAGHPSIPRAADIAASGSSLLHAIPVIRCFLPRGTQEQDRVQDPELSLLQPDMRFCMRLEALGRCSLHHCERPPHEKSSPRELSLSGNAVCEAAECLHIVLECWKEDSVDDGGRRCAGCAAPAARTSAKRLLFLCVSHELQDVTLLQPELGIDRTAIHSVLASSASPSFPPAASAAAAAFGRAAYFVSREDSGATSLGSVAYILFRHVQKARRIQQGNQGAFLAASTTRVEDTLEAHRREVHESPQHEQWQKQGQIWYPQEEHLSVQHVKLSHGVNEAACLLRETGEAAAGEGRPPGSVFVYSAHLLENCS
ncbi:hypothetical protein cyc_02735 [Cyclospora cayetanensis]|uniref:Uncharacterized protein n=1 Tax=Cyclospora cayetanensis TaxID=88456 RepID=A0A1D3CU33_9EIME|nr:hypothetical protein cyc_02735 [Cyclospora cayetanensis]